MVYITVYTGKQAVTQILKFYYVTMNDFFVVLLCSLEERAQMILEVIK